MSLEKPIVGTKRVVGFREQVVPSVENQNGIHVDGNSPLDIAWGDKENTYQSRQTKKWGKNGRKIVLQYFTWRKIAEQTLQIYNS
jgi:glycosyltransferase involved in cell wall biosynthesis